MRTAAVKASFATLGMSLKVTTLGNIDRATGGRVVRLGGESVAHDFKLKRNRAPPAVSVRTCVPVPLRAALS